MSAQDSADRVALLRTVLGGLVPLYQMRMACRGVPSDAYLAECADLIASSGDDLEHSRDPESAGSALNAMAEAIAALSMLRPEGIDLLGGHWCRDHANCGAGA